MSRQKNLLILGSTGGSGITTVEQALERGYHVTVYDRKPEKLPETSRQNKNLTIHKGLLPDAPKTLDPLIANFGAIISILGPNNMAGSGDELPNFYTWLLQKIRTLPEAERPYLLVMGTQSIADPQDTFQLFTSVHVFLIGVIAPGARYETNGIKRLFPPKGVNDDLDWCMYRLNVLNDGKGREGAKAGYVGCEGFKADMDREQLGKWLLDEVEQKKWVRKMPALWGER